jgi:hypothetical protein
MLAWSAGALPDPTGSQAPAMAGRGRRYGAEDGGGKGPGRPGAHPGYSGEVGWSGGAPTVMNFGQRRAQVRRGIRGRRWRFRVVEVDSSCGEEEEGVAELPGKSAELGEASSSGGRRRPWRHLQVVLREREPEREREMGESEGVVVASRRAPRWPGGSRRWRWRWPGASHAAAPCSQRRRQPAFCKKPPRHWRFLWNV